MGRWMSPDWSATAEPVPYAKLGDPQSLNLYAYVGNNPISGVDPDGHIDCSGSNAAGIGCQTQAAWYAHDNETTQEAGLAFVQNRSAQQQSQSGWTSQKPTSGDYVTVSDYSKSAGGFHHTGIAVDSDDTQGFSTLNPKTPWWQRLFGAPQGGMEDDLKMHTSPDGEVAPHSYLYRSITSDQAGAIQKTIDAQSRPDGAGRYNLIFRNCAGAVESFLHVGGVPGVPHSEIFIPAVLHGILTLESR